MYKIYFSLAWFTSRSPDFEIRTALKSFVLALGLGAAKNGTEPPHLAPGSMRGQGGRISLKRRILLTPTLPL